MSREGKGSIISDPEETGGRVEGERRIIIREVNLKVGLPGVRREEGGLTLGHIN